MTITPVSSRSAVDQPRRCARQRVCTRPRWLADGQLGALPRTAAPRPRPDGATGQISLFKALAGGWEEAPEGEDRTLLAS